MEDDLEFEVFHRGYFRQRSAEVDPIPSVMILSGGVRFCLNEAAYKALDSPVRVLLLFNKETQQIGIRATTPKDRNGYRVQNPQSSKRWVVSAKRFCEHYGVPTEDTRRLTTTLADDMLIAKVK